jgi:hypothetical protein
MTGPLDKRCTTINMPSPYRRRPHGAPAGPLLAAAPDTATSDIQAFITPLSERDLRRNTVVEPPKRSSLSRPPSFPVHTYMDVKTESPWLSYSKSYNLRFGICLYVVVAQRKTGKPREVCVRHFADPVDKAQLEMLRRRICHENFVETLDVFRFKETTYAVFERMAVSLHEIAYSPMAISEVQLAAVMAQVRVRHVAKPEQSTEGSR